MPIAVTLLQILAQYGPAVYNMAIELWHHPDPQKADFIALRDLIAKESYDGFIAEARAARGLPPLQAPPLVP